MDRKRECLQKYNEKSSENAKPISTHLHSFVPLFFPTCGINFHILFNHILPSRSSRQLFTTISDRPQSKTMIFSTLVNPPLPHRNPSSFQISSFPSSEFPSVSILSTPCILSCSHSSPHPLFVRLPLSWPSALQLVFPRLSAVPFVLFPDQLNALARALPRALTVYKKGINGKDVTQHTTMMNLTRW